MSVLKDGRFWLGVLVGWLVVGMFVPSPVSGLRAKAKAGVSG